MIKRRKRRRRQRGRQDEGEREDEEKEEEEEDKNSCMRNGVNSNINTTSCLILLANTKSCRDGTLRMQ